MRRGNCRVRARSSVYTRGTRCLCRGTLLLGVGEPRISLAVPCAAGRRFRAARCRENPTGHTFVIIPPCLELPVPSTLAMLALTDRPQANVSPLGPVFGGSRVPYALRRTLSRSDYRHGRQNLAPGASADRKATGCQRPSSACCRSAPPVAKPEASTSMREGRLGFQI